MSSLGDWKSATRMRDAIRRIVARQIDILRPLPKYGWVHEVAEDRSYAMIRFDGDDTPTKIPIGSTIPSAPGQVVRVAGPKGDRYIDDVVGTAIIRGGGVDIGHIFMWGGSVPPSNAFACKGGTIATSTYVALYGVLQYRHGGEGNVFGLPTLADPGPNLMYCIRAF